MKLLRLFPVFFLIIGGLGGCAGKSARTTSRLEVSLDESAEAYWMAFRWGEYTDAGAFALDPVAWQAFEGTLLENEAFFEISHVAVSRVVVELPPDEDSEEPATGTVFVRVDLTTLPSQRLEKPSIVQHWEMGRGGWMLKLEGNEAAVFLP